KHVGRPVLGCDEAEALLRVEPLHSSLWHLSIFPYSACPVSCTVGAPPFGAPGQSRPLCHCGVSVHPPTQSSPEPRPQRRSCESLTRTQKLTTAHQSIMFVASATVCG